LRRGEIWTIAGAKDYAGKPRPAVILQSDRFELTDSLTVCFCTGTEIAAPLFRIGVAPTAKNGLREHSWLMADKVTSVPKTKVGKHIGILDAENMTKLESAIITFLGIAR